MVKSGRCGEWRCTRVWNGTTVILLLWRPRENVFFFLPLDATSLSLQRRSPPENGATQRASSSAVTGWAMDVPLGGPCQREYLHIIIVLYVKATECSVCCVHIARRTWYGRTTNQCVTLRGEFVGRGAGHTARTCVFVRVCDKFFNQFSLGEPAVDLFHVSYQLDLVPQPIFSPDYRRYSR